MPTGYTQRILDAKTPLTLRQFTLLCARAFGALIEMRDDDLDAPIPEEFKPSDYHLKELDKAKSKLVRLSKWTKTQQKAFNVAERKKQVKRLKKSLATTEAENSRLSNMRELVTTWDCPFQLLTLKDFMMDQIKISMHTTEYETKALSEAEKADHYQTELRSAARDIEYHTERYAEEVNRIKERNEWIKQLRESLPPI